MNKKEDFEWQALPGLSEINCEGQEGNCANAARWERFLLLSTKSAYERIGCFCNECKEKQENYV